MAHATDPIGPAHVNSGAVVATASAPYATATEQTGDTTTVVSASYVKGAYNDAIAAVNKVNSEKQGKLVNDFTGDGISENVLALGQLQQATFKDDGFDTWYDSVDDLRDIDGVDNALMSASGVITLVKIAVDEVQGINNSKRVRAVTTWGQDSNTSLIPFANAQ